jgi:predicted ArsR family transcriptional regulator
VGEAMQDALAALGFAPRHELQGKGRHRYVLRNCPYRRAVRANQPAVCALHRGVTAGLLDSLDARSTLAQFVPEDPDVAGCVIEVQERGGGGALRTPPPHTPR